MMEDRLLQLLIDDVLSDLCFEMHQQVKTVGMTLDELYDVDSLDHVDQPPVEPQSLVVCCSKCKRQIHASRYALHLEKCIAGTRRQSSMQRNGDEVSASQAS